MRMHNPPHPGLVLREYLSGYRDFHGCGTFRVSRVTLSRVLNGKGWAFPRTWLSGWPPPSALPQNFG